MCGVVGIVDFRAPVEPWRVDRMGQFLQHRGPDARGLWCDSQVGMGVRRLAIVDVRNGDQPTSNEDGTVHVAFNGEIYNHREIRRRLARRGHRFRSLSDVEVIPHLYEEVGLGFVEELDGDFAIALWDTDLRRLVLSRDRVGVKPLFYHVDGPRLIFASEIKGIFASDLCDIEVDPQGVSDCLFYSHPVPPSTFWTGIRDLEPGTVACFGTNGLSQRRYFVPFQRRDPDLPLLSGRTGIEKFAHAFEAAVRKRLPDEVGAGISLSGGLDSTAIAAVAARLCGSSLPTSSIRLVGEEGHGLDETSFSRHAASELGLENQEIEITGARVCELLPQSLWHFESPFWFGAVATPFLDMTRAARERGLKVALTGDGSDELLAGYDFYRLLQLHRRLTSWKIGWLQPPIWRNAVKWLKAPAGIDTHILGVNARLAALDGHYGEVPPWIYLWSAIGDVARPLIDGDVLPAPTPVPAPPRHDRLRRQLHFEFHTRLPGWILVVSDRIGMANGIEVRVPYLDRDVIDVCTELAPDLLIRRGVAKYVLREAFSDIVPRRIVRRKKRPFMTPIAPWYLTGPGKELAGDYLCAATVKATGLFDPDAVQALWRRATREGGTWEGAVSEWVCLMVMSTHILLDEFNRARFLANPA